MTNITFCVPDSPLPHFILTLSTPLYFIELKAFETVNVSQETQSFKPLANQTFNFVEIKSLLFTYT